MVFECYKKIKKYATINNDRLSGGLNGCWLWRMGRLVTDALRPRTPRQQGGQESDSRLPTVSVSNRLFCRYFRPLIIYTQTTAFRPDVAVTMYQNSSPICACLSLVCIINFQKTYCALNCQQMGVYLSFAVQTECWYKRKQNKACEVCNVNARANAACLFHRSDNSETYECILYVNGLLAMSQKPYLHAVTLGDRRGR